MGREFSCAALVFIFLGSFMSAIASFPVADMTVLGSMVTNVGGTIIDNTTWTLENSPYFLVDDVTIAQNATLTIEPGVAVDLDFWQLSVKGTLRAIGNETHRINITTVESPLTNNNRILFDDASSPWNETAGTGCTIQYALVNMNFTGTGCIAIRGGTPKLSNNIMYLQCDDAGILAGGLVMNNTIMYNGYRAIVVGGSPSIGFNLIEGKLQTGIHVAGGDSAVIFGNLIKNTTYLGYGYESNSGGFVFSGGWSGYPIVVNNTIVNCNHGVTFPPYSSGWFNRTDFEFNNVYSTGYAVEVGKTDPRITIALPNNWWGTNDSAIIDQIIYDQNDDRTLCLVNYTGFLMMPTPFPLDSTPPMTLQNYDGLWHTQAFNITLSATDDLLGVWNTFYKINDGGAKMVRLNGMPQITVEGADNSLEYWSLDYAGNEEDHHVLTGIKLDETTPQGSILINSGATYTNVTQVGLSLNAVDAVSGISQMCFLNDGDSWSSWELYATSKSWSLEAGDGVKNVYVQYRDLAGLTVTSYDSITLDTMLPVANAGQNQNAQVGQVVTFNGTGSTDNTGIASYVWNFGDGTSGTGVTPPHTYSSVGTYTVSLMVIDLAGNSAASTATVTVEVIIPEFPSSAIVTVLLALVSAFSLTFRKKMKPGKARNRNSL
jgi:PKD domain